ncbi:hypothetical protein ACWCOP_02710 [Maricaulaceae bacterium MS644]
MRAYLPLVFEVLLAAVVIGWGVRELILLNRDKTDETSDSATPDKDKGELG